MAKLMFKITIPDDSELTKSILMKMDEVFSEGGESSYSDDELNELKNVINVISDLTESSHPRHDAELLKDAFNAVVDEIWSHLPETVVDKSNDETTVNNELINELIHLRRYVKERIFALDALGVGAWDVKQVLKDISDELKNIINKVYGAESCCDDTKSDDKPSGAAKATQLLLYLKYYATTTPITKALKTYALEHPELSCDEVINIIGLITELEKGMNKHE